MNQLNRHKRELSSGFTLAESVIALGILVVLITGFLAVFGPAADSVRRTLSAEDASRLQSTLVDELSTLRSNRERSQYRNEVFGKTFEWASQSHVQGSSVLVYKYKGDPARTRDDGSLEAYESAEGIVGQDYLIQPACRRLNDPLLEDDLQAIDGRVFMVKLTQLLNTDGSWAPAGDAEEPSQISQISRITNPYDPDGNDFTRNPDEFPEAVITFEARFFLLPTNTFQYISSFDPTRLNRPEFIRNIAILR